MRLMPLMIFEFLLFAAVTGMFCLALGGFFHKSVSAALKEQNMPFFYLWFAWMFLFGGMTSVIMMAVTWWR